MAKMQTPRKRDVGRAVKVLFYDHAENLDHPILTEVYGRVIGVTKKYIRLISWATPQDETSDDSKTTWVVMRSTIDTYTRLMPEGDMTCSMTKR